MSAAVYTPAAPGRFNETLWTVRQGFRRGRIEIRQNLTSPPNLLMFLFTTVILLVVLLFLQHKTVPGSPHFSLSTMLLPSVLGLNIGFNGLTTTAGLLINDRADGTLLRAKTIPNGMAGYLIGKVVLVSGMSTIGLFITLIPGLFLFKGLSLVSVVGWLTLIWVIALGLVATIPLGATIGSFFANPRLALLIFLPTAGLSVISGIFYPITHLPRLLQWIAQIFPLYWLGLGMRSALLPAYMARVELDHSWRHLMTFGVLLAWAAVGLLIAPGVLRRMARRESGSALSARREKVTARPG
jgi:ABC-2 type transport system permease protein